MDNRTIEEVRSNETKLIKEIVELEQQLKKKQDVIDKAIEYIDKALLGEFPGGVMYWLKDDEVGKNLLDILKDVE